MQIDPNKKLAGILAPVFALRSSNDLGVGDTDSVREMVDWCSQRHFSVLQTLPIQETGDDNSPYNAISSIAIDPATIAISPEKIPDLTPRAYGRLVTPSLLDELRRGPVLYRKVKPLKLGLLEAAFSNFLKNQDAKKTLRGIEFRKFIWENRNWIKDYSLFRALMDLNHNLPAWEEWPLEHRDPARARDWIQSRPAKERGNIENRRLFYSYVQWIARQQWTGLKKHAEKQGVALMGDIPFGIGRCSVDVWSKKEQFDLRWSCGAPPESYFKPDLFTEKWGQNWGIPLYRWDRMRADGYSWWRARTQATCEIFHYFRIDHVLGFYRIYSFPWQPMDNGQFVNLNHEQARAKAGDLPRFWPCDDSTEENRRGNQARGEELLRMVIESAGDSGVVAEDLGIVPDYVRPSLMGLGLPGFKIPIFERHSDGTYKDSNHYPPLSVATAGTHDNEPLAALWQRWSRSNEGKAEKIHMLTWMNWGWREGPMDWTPETQAFFWRKLLSCPSWLVVMMITDLFGQTARFNVPGPASDSNWSERLSFPVSQFDQNLDMKQFEQKVTRILPRKT